MKLMAKEEVLEIKESVETKDRISLWSRLLIKLGLRSECCGAKLYSWHPYKRYCTKCEKRA